jgi:hypothetical protein
MRTAALCFCFCFCFCLVSNDVVAQAEQPYPGGLAATGVVVGTNGQPKAGVPLRVEGPQGKTHAITDEKGTWSLYNLAPGSYKVEALEKGAQSDTINFDVKPRPWYQFGTPAVFKAPDIRLAR